MKHFKIFPWPDPDTGDLVPTKFWDTYAIAKKLGNCSRDKVRRKCARNEWPHVVEDGTGHYYMNDAMLAEVVASWHRPADQLVRPRPTLVAAWDEDELEESR